MVLCGFAAALPAGGPIFSCLLPAVLQDPWRGLATDGVILCFNCRRFRGLQTDGTFIGFAETTVEVGAEERLMVRSSAPRMVSQPGALIVSPYDPREADRLLRARQDSIRRDTAAEAQRRQEQERQYGNGIKWGILFAVAAGVLPALGMIPYWPAL